MAAEGAVLLAAAAAAVAAVAAAAVVVGRASHRVGVAVVAVACHAGGLWRARHP